MPPIHDKKKTREKTTLSVVSASRCFDDGEITRYLFPKSPVSFSVRFIAVEASFAFRLRGNLRIMQAIAKHAGDLDSLCCTAAHHTRDNRNRSNEAHSGLLDNIALVVIVVAVATAASSTPYYHKVDDHNDDDNDNDGH